MEKNIRKIIAIVGPTASGKTGIGVKLAKELDGEIVSADSRQVYKGLDLGTGKDLVEFGDVKYHLIDICKPGERFTLFDYLPLAREAIEDIFERGKVPIIVGGTGLYIQALTEGFGLQKSEILNPKSKTNSKYQILNRQQLEKSTVEQLRKILQAIDSQSFKTIDIQNPYRLIRAIERAQEGNIPTKEKPDFEVLQIGINWPRETLYSRIDKRVEERFEQGMLNEVVSLLNNGVNQDWLLSLGLEYKVITNFVISNFQFPISNKISNSQMTNNNCESFEQMKQVLKYKIHQFSKHQMTWFGRFPEIIWGNDYYKISKTAKKFLQSSPSKAR